MPSDATQLARALHAHRDALKAFLAARVGSAAEAEDILQNGLAKAVQRAGDVRDDEKVVAWFYQLLRHALVDHYRTQGATRRRDDSLGTLIAALGDDTAPAAVLEKQLCTCLDGVVGTLKPLHVELLRRVDLDGESVQDAARVLQISANNASVTLHRARKELRAPRGVLRRLRRRSLPRLRLRRLGRRPPHCHLHLQPGLKCHPIGDTFTPAPL